MDIDTQTIETHGDCLHIPISSVCNNNCIFCNEDRKLWSKTNSEYGPKVVNTLLKKYGTTISRVNFTSGEPLMNPNIIHYVRQAQRYGFDSISITTNARMLAYKKYALDIVQSGVTEIIVSIHGHTPKVHNALTRTKGSFEQTSQGLANLSELIKVGKFKGKLTAAITLNRMNFMYFGDMVQSLGQYKLTEAVFNIVQPVRTNMNDHFDRVMPRYGDVAKVIETFYLKNKDYFYDAIGRRIISIIDLPFCQSDILTPLFGQGETRIVEDMKHVESVGTDSCNRLEKKVLVDNRSDKTKDAGCHTCDFSNYCNGVYKMYIQHYGWNEFVPVKKKPVL